MLPATLQFLIVMIASAINDRLQRKLDYVEEERRVLREQRDAVNAGKKLSFTANQRRRLAGAGKLLSTDERRKCCELVNRPGAHGKVVCRSRLGGCSTSTLGRPHECRR